MIDIPVPFAKLDNSINTPAYAHEGDAGIDLRSTIDCVIEPFERFVVPTGVAFAIPEGYAGLVIPRSGLAAKHGVSIVNAPGLIDSGYRGEIKCIAINLDPQNDISIQVGDRVAQLVVMKVENLQLMQVDELDATQRGEGGFGSSGTN